MDIRGRGSRIVQVLGVLVAGAGFGMLLGLMMPTIESAAAVYAVATVSIAIGLALIHWARPRDAAVPHPHGSRPLLLGGLLSGGLGAIVASGVLLPASSQPSGVYAIAAVLLMSGLGLVHRGRMADDYARLLLGFVLFSSCIGVVSFVVVGRLMGWWLLSIPFAVLGLGVALFLEMGGVESHRPRAPSAA